MRPEQYLQAAQAYLVASARSRAHGPGADRPRPFLTISREAGAGAHALAAALVEVLGAEAAEPPWTMFDDNLVQEVLKDHDLPAQLGRYMSEDKVAEVEEFVAVSLGLHPHKEALVAKVNATIIALARMGHVILVGRGAHVLTRPLAGGFHVRLIASEGRRREYLARAHGIDAGRAAEKIVALDAGRKAYVRRHFGSDVTDPMAYDLVVNTTGQQIDAVADMLATRLARAVESAPAPRR